MRHGEAFTDFLIKEEPFLVTFRFLPNLLKYEEKIFSELEKPPKEQLETIM
jgi:hypothetical protein